MKNLILLFWVLNSAFATEVLFDCQTPFDPFDPNFQQGSEVFLKITVDDQKEISLITEKFDQPETPLFQGEKSPFHLGTGLSSLSARFSSGYLSMVYLGNSSGKEKWGAFLKEGDWEEEFFCFEKIDIIRL